MKKTVWLVTFFGRGDEEDGRDAVEAYASEGGALRGIATVLREWVSDGEYVNHAPTRANLSTLLQREHYRAALTLWNDYAENRHYPAAIYGIGLIEVPFDASEHSVVKEDAKPLQYVTTEQSYPIALLQESSAATVCPACGDALDVNHVVSMHNREFCSLECADVPRNDWTYDRFDEPLRCYRDFYVWPDGTIMPPGRYDQSVSIDEDTELGCAAAEKVMQANPTVGAVPHECESDEPCRGWEIFDSGERGFEIDRIDTCDVFKDDDDALEAAIKFFDECATT